MRIKKTVSSLLAASLLAAGISAAFITPAAAEPMGPLVPGDVYLFNAVGTPTTLLPSDQILTATKTATSINPKSFKTLYIDGVAPAGTFQIQPSIRIPQAGVPEDDWTQVPIGAQEGEDDGTGRWFLNTTAGDPLVKGELLTWLAAQPNKTGTFPFVVSYCDIDANYLGYARTTITMSLTSTDASTYTWTVDSPVWAPAKAPATVALAASASSVEAGTAVDLTATVTPASATGSVEFFAGTTSLGSAAVASGSAVLSATNIPVGTNAITAKYSGSNADATSSAVSVVVAPVAPRATTTTLAVDNVAGDPYKPVTFTATVSAATGAANGTVTIKDGSVVLGSTPVVAGVAAPITLGSGLGLGAHSFVAEFTGSAPYTSSVSAAVVATYTSSAVTDDQTVVVTIPTGAITITTPYTPAAPLDLGEAVLDPADSTFSASAAFNDIVINDTRSGNLGFTASVVSGAFANAAGETFPGDHAGLTGLVATAIANNALLPADVTLTNNTAFAPGLGTPKVFATYPAGKSTGSVKIDGTFGIDGVPTSVKPGLYTSTVTFSVI